MLTEQIENIRHNILEIYRHDRNAPQALTYLSVFKFTFVTWAALTSGCALGLHSLLEIAFRVKYGVPGPLGQEELVILLFSTIPLLYCFKPLFLRGRHWFVNLGFLLPAAANAWYPSRRRTIVTIFLLVNVGMMFPMMVWFLNWHYSTAANFRWLSWIVSFLAAQGHLLAGVMSAASSYEFSNGPTTDGQPSMVPISPSELNARDDGLVITHLSDLHLTGGSLTLERAPSPDAQFAHTLKTFRSQIQKSDVVLLTGDITDCGKPEEWSSFFSHYPMEIREKTVILPGNHDINIAGSSRFQFNDPKMVCRAARLIRTILAIRLIQGDRAYVVDGKDKVVLFSSFIDRILPELIDFLYSDHKLEPIIEVDEFRGYKAEDRFSEVVPMPVRIMSIWNQIFPMAIPVSKDTTIYIFDSSRRNHAILDNAFGELLAREKLDPLKRLNILKSAEKLQKTRALFAMHHHIVLPIRPKTFFGRIQARAMVMLDAPRVYYHLRNMAASVVFHGHRHIHYLFSIENKVQVVSAPSTTLGDEFNKQGPGFYQYRIIPIGKRGNKIDGVARYDSQRGV